MSGVDNVRNFGFVVATVKNQRVSRQWIGVGCVLLMTAASACSAHSGAIHDSADLLCTVEGVKLLSPAMNSDAVCEIFKAKIDEKLARKTVSVNSASEPDSANWIKLNIRFSHPGTASAMVVQNESGMQTIHPEIAVDVMDKAIGRTEVTMLAVEVARTVAKAQKN